MSETVVSDDLLPRRIGIVGYGNLGKYLAEEIQKTPGLELAFIWNRTQSALIDQVDDKHILHDLQHFAERNPDLIVEVAHPAIAQHYGAQLLQHCDLMVGSPTALAVQETEDRLKAAAVHHGMYIPAGAFWGGEDIKKMADRDTLQALKVTMTKHPDCFKLQGYLKELNEKVTERTVLYDGAVRGLCPLAPNNINTMAAAAMAAHTLGWDAVQGCIVADPKITDWHIVEVETWGAGDISAGTAFHVSTVRRNPSKLGQVTGSATYASFLSSMLGAHGKGPGVHLC